MAAIKMDRSGFPLVKVTYPEHWGLADLELHFQELRALLKENRAYVMFQDMRASGIGDDADARKRGVSFMKEVEDETTRLCRGAVTVVSSKIIRLALQGIFAISKPRYPYVIMENEDEALAWARQKAWETHPPAVTPKLPEERRHTPTPRIRPAG